MVTLEDVKSHLGKISETDWNKLFSFIPLFENSTEIENVKISEFLDVLYKMEIIVDFDWPDWEEGKLILNSGNFNGEFDAITLVKLITTIVRSDRFNEGLLEIMCKNGFVVHILKSLKLKYS